MPAGTYNNGAVAITSAAPVLICTPNAGHTSLLLSNSAGATVFVGGPNVAASGANVGFALVASGTANVPVSPSLDCPLYGIVASTGSTVTYLFPSSVD